MYTSWKWRLPRHGFWLRTSVRALMLLILLVGGGLGWLVHRAHQQRDAVAAIQRAGGYVEYDWQFRGGVPVSNGAPQYPRWIVDGVGVDYFSNVVSVFLEGEVSDAEMAHVGHLGRLERLTMEGSTVTDAMLAHLVGLTRLNTLELNGTQVGDAGLARLKALTSLEILSLGGTRTSDSGMAHLAGLTRLESLNLVYTRVGDSGLAHLKGLKSLRLLFLGGRVSDAGLVHLTGLTGLRRVTFGDEDDATRVTDAGIRALQVALPGTRIGR